MIRRGQSYHEDLKDCLSHGRDTLLSLRFTDVGEPTTYGEASACADSATWHLAMESEMNSIQHNQTWDLVELPKNQHALPCKWVYQLKETPDLANLKYKAKLVVKGFRLDYGINIDEIFSPIVKMSTL